MVEEVVMRQDIPLDDFLPIFVSSALVMVFGGFYVGIYTAVKVNLLKKWTMPIAYHILDVNCLLSISNGKFDAW